jgi:hypothetical protein
VVEKFNEFMELDDSSPGMPHHSPNGPSDEPNEYSLQLTSCYRAFIEMLVTHPVNKFLAVKEPEASLLCSQKHVNGSHFKRIQSKPHLHSLLLENPFWYYSPISA